MFIIRNQAHLVDRPFTEGRSAFGARFDPAAIEAQQSPDGCFIGKPLPQQLNTAPGNFHRFA